MNFLHPTFHNISLINAVIQANEEEEHERLHRAEPLPSDELPSGSGSSTLPSDELPPAMAVFFVILFVLVIVLAIVFS